MKLLSVLDEPGVCSPPPAPLLLFLVRPSAACLQPLLCCGVKVNRLTFSQLLSLEEVLEEVLQQTKPALR